MLRLMIVVLSISASSCTLGRKKHDSKQPVKAKTWPEYMEANLSASSFDIAWGLLSSSGYADRGQVILFVKADHSSGEAHMVKATESEVSQRRSLSKEEIARVKALVAESSSLKDYESQTFDGIRYRFIRMRKSGGGIETQQSIKMNNPGVIDPKPKKHIDLVEGFYALAK